MYGNYAERLHTQQKQAPREAFRTGQVSRLTHQQQSRQRTD